MNNRNIKILSPFVLCCQKVIPLAFDESMSYYECLCGLYNYIMNNVTPAINENADAVTELQNYVAHYFDNLDVQEEINNKLDEMAEDGTLENLISQYLELQTTFTYDTVDDMKNATNLINGCFAKTVGFYDYNDGGGAFYKVREITNQDTIDEMFIIALNDTSLIAELIINDNKVNVKQCGVTGNSNEDATIKLTKLFNTTYDLYFPSGTYNTTSPLVLTSCKLIGEDVNTTIIKYNNETSHGELINSYNLNNLLIKNICFDCGSLKNILKTSINLYYTNGLKIVNCEFKNGHGSHLRLNDSVNVLIENCYFHDIDGDVGNVGNAIYCHPTSNLTITKCRCERLMEDFLYLDGASDNPVKNVYVNNNVITYTGYNNNISSANAIGINGNCQNIFIKNNIISNNINGIKTDIRYDVTPKNVVISDNIISDNTLNATSLIGDYILTSNNVMQNNGQDGIYSKSGTYHNHINNQIINTTRNSVWVLNASHVNISDCIIKGTGLAGATGIITGNSSNTPHFITIKNCEVYDTITGIQVIYGENMRLISNYSHDNTVNYDIRNITNMINQLNPLQYKSEIRNILFSDTIPTNGNNKVGDIVLFTNATAGGYVGAVCVSAGIPGTWKQFGAISS